MTLQLDFWHLVTLLLGFFGFVAGGAKILFDQIDRRLNERFAALEQARQSADRAMQDELARLINEDEKLGGKLEKLDHDYLKGLADMPVLYTRREDYIRNQTVLEHKIDALYLKLDATRLGGSLHA